MQIHEHQQLLTAVNGKTRFVDALDTDAHAPRRRERAKTGEAALVSYPLLTAVCSVHRLLPADTEPMHMS
jgi:hypothetical protein